jgi:hypothetical protein
MNQSLLIKDNISILQISIFSAKSKAQKILENLNKLVNEKSNVNIQVHTRYESNWVGFLFMQQGLDYDSGLNFTCKLIKGELQFFKRFNSTPSENIELEAMSDFTNTLIRFNETIQNLDFTAIKQLLESINEIQKECINKASKIERLEEQLFLEEQKSEIRYISSLLEPINSFCVNTFLSEQLNIPLINGKANIKEVNKKLSSNESHTYKFITYCFKHNKINFELNYLFVNNKKCELLTDGLTIRSKSKINEFLTQQFTINNILITNENVDKKMPFYKINSSNNFDLDEIKNLLKPFKIRKIAIGM